MRFPSTASLPFALLGTLALVTAPLLAAHDYAAGELVLLHPGASPTPPGVSAAAGYLTIVNAGTVGERLLGGSAPFADGIELHRTTVEDDVARMRRIDGGLEIPTGATVRLEPGGTHLMFTGLIEPLPDGERRPATLVFERAGEVEVEFAIERPTAGGESGREQGHGAMDHGATDHGVPDHDTVDGGAAGHGGATGEPMPHGDVDHGAAGHGDGGSKAMPDGDRDHGEAGHDGTMPAAK